MTRGRAAMTSADSIREEGGTTLWSTPEWRASAVAWLDARLSDVGLERTGEVEQPHLRPWATSSRGPRLAVHA